MTDRYPTGSVSVAGQQRLTTLRSLATGLGIDIPYLLLTTYYFQDSYYVLRILYHPCREDVALGFSGERSTTLDYTTLNIDLFLLCFVFLFAVDGCITLLNSFWFLSFFLSSLSGLMVVGAVGLVD